MSDACDRAKLARRNGSKKCLIQCGTAEAGYEAELPATVLNRSPIIKEAVCIADGTPRLVLPFSAEFYRAWLDHVSASSRCAPIPTDTAVKGLQAADFFADERAVQDFAQLLSDRMFPPEELDGTNPEQQQQPPPKKQKTEPYQEHACWDSLQEQKVHNEQIVQQLSLQLMSSVLMAANVSLPRCISLLPCHMHALVVSTMCCVDTAHQQLVLSHQHTLTTKYCGSSSTADSSSLQAYRARHSLRCDALIAASRLTNITLLELSTSFLTGLKHSNELQKAAKALFSSLGSLSELIFPDGITSACVQVLVPELPHMMALQHLSISNSEPHDSSSHWSVAGTPASSFDEGGWGNQADSAPDSPATQPCNVDPDDVISVKVPGSDVHAVNTLIQHLHVVPGLISLSLVATKPDCSQIVEFCGGLQQLTGLTGLALIDCFVHRGSEAVGDGLKVTQWLGGALAHLRLLRHLNLQGSLAGDIINPVLDSIAGLTDLTHLCLHSVHCMSAVECSLPSRVAHENAGFGRRLAPMLNELKALQFLDLSECFIPTSTMGDVVSAIASLSCLTHLEMQQISREDEVTSLVSLEQLIVCMNPCIRDNNVGKLAQSLSKLPNLHCLDMHCCRLSKVGAVALAQHLTCMTALRDLHLQLNRIQPSGAKALSECMRTMSQLQQVTLLDTDIEDEGEQIIVVALEESRGHDWQGDISLSVLEANKALTQEYFQMGLDWFARYWERPERTQQLREPDQVEEDPFFSLFLRLLEG